MPISARSLGLLPRSFRFRALSTSLRQQTRHLLDELQQRGLLQALTSRSLRSHLSDQTKRTVYAGVDPSAKSLHVGNLLPLMALLHFAKHGHTSLALIGGATGSIGDPSGRSTERSALDKQEVDQNVQAITNQLKQFFERAQEYIQRREADSTVVRNSEAVATTPMEDAAAFASGGKAAQVAAEKAFSSYSADPFGPSCQADTDKDGLGKVLADGKLNVRLVNNLQWTSGLGVLDFLGTVGRHARVNTMMSRESVKNRITPEDQSGDAIGLSFTEFSYQLLQAYDFSVLHGQPWNCSIQIGGSDQMGNIMAGVDLIRRQKAASSSTSTAPSKQEDSNEKYQGPAYGLTLPLLTTASGAKFGKSAGNAVWISPDLLSDVDFFQFFVRSRDAEVEKYLRALTLLPVEEIEGIMKQHEQEPKLRFAQYRLAEEVTELVRGQDALKRALVATRVLFETKLDGLEVATIRDAFASGQGKPVLVQLANRDDFVGQDLTKVCASVGLVKSRAEAKRSLTSGGLYVNNRAIPAPVNGAKTLSDADLLGRKGEEQFAILRVGKTEHRIVIVPI